jgi:SAM-dependent methyltransferase
MFLFELSAPGTPTMSQIGTAPKCHLLPAPSPRIHTSYDSGYYGPDGPAENRDSAQHVVPLVSSLIHPSSVVDVGCGSGAWLDVFRQHGAARILGLDGPHVDPSWLCIPKCCFRAVDLSHPFQLAESFDLAVCLEVAEHLPKQSARGFIRSLVRLAPVVLFSAAVPLQGGTHHINEQWPAYWQDLFATHGYRMLDLIRKEIWSKPEVQFWYRQNILLFMREDLVKSQPRFQAAASLAGDLILMHREILERQFGLRALLRHLPRSAFRAARRVSRRLSLAA